MSGNGDYISREASFNAILKLVPKVDDDGYCWVIRGDAATAIDSIPAADVIDEENVLKFYYVRSTDDYWIGQRVGNFYYAEFDPESFRWTWTHSRHLPWGEHVVSLTSLWKEHTYPSEPEELPFEAWLRGLFKKLFPAADVRPVVRGKWEVGGMFDDIGRCSNCHYMFPLETAMTEFHFCPNCGADMRGEQDV